MRNNIKIFADAMENKLQTKDDEHGQCGWMNSETTIKYLKDRLMEEVQELCVSFDECDSEGVSNECVDIANFAMMIYTRFVYIKTNGNINAKHR